MAGGGCVPSGVAAEVLVATLRCSCLLLLLLLLLLLSVHWVKAGWR